MKKLSATLLLMTTALLLNSFTHHGNSPATGELTIRFSHKAGDKDLKFDTTRYRNSSGEMFTVSRFQYFVSNIRLQKKDGSVFTVKQDSSYFLVNAEDPASTSIHLKVPEGEYKSLEFIIGIDSIRNTVPIAKRNGILDPSTSMDNGMYWSWNSGYIFLKIEGESASAPADPKGQKKFRYHIGGFGGYNAPTINNIKKVSLDITETGRIKVEKVKPASIHLVADILKVFTGKSEVSIHDHSSVMFSEYSVNIANNYSQMFYFKASNK